jgi:ribonucleoside-diphosphate reductase alpha chain
LWRAIASAAHACGEPGLLFVDRINRENNLGDVEMLTTTNPCAEAPLPPYGACCLGSVNVLKFVRAPYAANAHLDLERIDAVVSTAVRLLDNVLDCTLYPLPEQRATALATRRIGLGITGLADALTMLGLRYGTAAALECASALLRRIRDAAYAASCALAREKGSFPSLRPAAYLDRPFISRLPAALRDEIRRHGVRNSHLLAIAPAGSISLLAGNVSSGIEPPAGERYQLTLSFGPSAGTPLPVENLACQEWRAGGRAGLPPAFVAAAQVPPQAQLALQSELQRYVDGAISKTVALPRSAAVGAVERLYTAALRSQVKGVTVFRRGAQRAPMECSVSDCT